MNELNGPLKTPLYQMHVDAGAKLIEFGGWLMPVQYSGIVAEHRAVRAKAGIFDLSHMGRIQLSGPKSARFLQFLATNDVFRLSIGRIQYSLLCNRSGGVRDDVLIYRLGECEYLLVVNASNRLKVLGWIDEIKNNMPIGLAAADIDIEDRTFETVMVGIQGPSSETILSPLADLSLQQLRYYHVVEGQVMGKMSLVSRTGYTGEDGFEVILPVEAGIQLWDCLSKIAGSEGVVLAGLGARDTLRMEAGMPLYGHELDETINPIEAGLTRFVQMEKGDFVGRDALEPVAQSGPKRRLVGLEVTDRAIARQGTPVLAAGAEVGRITSGSYSPTLDKSIAMAFIDSSVVDRSGPLEVVVRGSAHPASIVSLPFYRRKKHT